MVSRTFIPLVNEGGRRRVCPSVVGLLSSSLICWATISAQTGPDELIQKVQSRYNKAQSLAVNFVEEYSLLGHRRPPEEGTLTLRKVGKMRWDYRRPPGKLFVSDGKNVFLYTSLDNRVEKIPLKDTEDMRAPMAFLLGRLDLKKEFKDFQVRPAQDGSWLSGTAKSERVPYRQVEMLIHPEGIIRGLKVFGRDESVLSFAFTDEKINPVVNDSMFHFEIPAGAQVTDAVEFKSQEK